VAGPVAALAAAALVLAIGSGGPPTQPVPPPMAIQPEPSPGLARGLADRVTQAFAKTPLDTELDDLIHDGRRGLDAVLAAGGLR